MRYSLISLVKKDLRLMISGKFFFLAVSSLILFSCYINFLYITNDVTEYPVYLFDPTETQNSVSPLITFVTSLDELKSNLKDDMSAIGIDASSKDLRIIQYESGSKKLENYRANYAITLLRANSIIQAQHIGENNRQMKLRKEMTCEVLFFEIVAIGFLGIASLLFKEKQMGVIRVHGILPMKRSLFILSKLWIFLISDLCFAFLLVVINIGLSTTWAILPEILLQTCMLSIIMTLLGFGCTMLFSDFKQFTVGYLFITLLMVTPVFLAANVAFSWEWVKYYPIYHLYMGIKNAFFGTSTNSSIYYIGRFIAVILLFVGVWKGFKRTLVED